MTSRASQTQVADYIQTVLLEVRTMARGAQLDFLTYTVEMALIEASDVAAGKRPASMPVSAQGTAGSGRREQPPSPEEIVRRVLLAK